METRASYVLIGAFTLAVLALAFAFVLWIGKLSLDREWDEYEILFEEAVTGLSIGGAVQYNGIQVGEVRRLSLDPQDPGRVIAHVRIAAGTPVKTDTRAKLTLTGLTGVAVIQLSGGTRDAPPLAAREGERWPRIVADDSALQKLLSSSEGIVTSVNDMLLRVSLLLDEDNLAKLAATIDHVEQITGAVAAESDGVGRALADIGAASEALRATMQRTESLVARLERTAASAESLIDGEARTALVELRRTLDAARTLADEATATLAENRTAVSGFTQEGLSQVAPALAELRATLRHLEQVTAQLEQDPAAWLLSRDRPREYDAR